MYINIANNPTIAIYLNVLYHDAIVPLRAFQPSEEFACSSPFFTTFPPIKSILNNSISPLKISSGVYLKLGYFNSGTIPLLFLNSSI